LPDLSGERFDVPFGARFVVRFRDPPLRAGDLERAPPFEAAVPAASARLASSAFSRSGVAPSARGACDSS
jgi:hypothetical protein